ncbi:hypothetical protein [Nocardia sp. NPDC005978]|uniref:Rv0361 family membrane protein n=1 Tax=unclassified Nocardia TaxID=2637762 RepID=UPI0033BD847A
MTLPPGGQPHAPAQDAERSTGTGNGGRRPLLIGLLVAAVVVVGGGVAATLALTGKSDPSAAEQIDSAIRDFYGTLSAEGPSVAVEKACAADRAEFAALPDAQKVAADRGRFTIRIVGVADIAIAAETATAQMTGALALAGAEDKTTTATEHLRLESGSWKVCSADGK